MPSARHYLESVNGTQYHYHREPISAVLTIPDNRLVWHLFTAGTYLGHFTTKTALRRYIGASPPAPSHSR